MWLLSILVWKVKLILMVQPWIFIQVGCSELHLYHSPILHSLIHHNQFHRRQSSQGIIQNFAIEIVRHKLEISNNRAECFGGHLKPKVLTCMVP